ncbi:MAG TPA: efflux transporter outer membrane subunit [Caulobacteraceae bacterium]|jgi:NodT family efflux transporter outer membrane factor (OMF) lipoprotein|nr:efflux transporter outer membrane subunit [Caulobacteraceae bacterium]
MPGSKGRARLLAGGAIQLALAGSLAGCMVGPNYRGPPKVTPEAVNAPAFRRAGPDQSAAPPPARWWTSLGDAELDRLETAALASSPDLEAAAARVREARAVLSQNKANALPSSGTSAIYLHAKGLTSALGAAPAGSGTPGQPSPSPVTQSYAAVLDATWELDLFGGNRRAIEGARASTQAYRDDLQGAEVSLTAEVAQAYLSLRDAQARLDQSHRDADIEARTLAMERQRQAGGVATDLDVERLNDQVLSTVANFAPLQAEITAQLDRLAVLTGRAPGDLDPQLVGVTPAPLPPAKVDVGDPAELLQRRPDVRAAERRIEQQTAVIGQKTANLFPKVQLLGDIGFTGNKVESLFTPADLLYVVAPVLQWSPFDFGRTRATIRQAKATRDEAVADYRKTVLTALDDAETSLARYGRQREAVVALTEVKMSADRAAQLTDLRFQGGTATTVDVLDAERNRVQAETNLEQAQVQLTQDFVALQKSLGLGWRES